MIVSKAEFAALANVSPGRVSQWISAGRIGPDELDGKGRGARIKAQAAAAKLKLKLDIDPGKSTELSIAQKKHVELAMATAGCCAAARAWESKRSGADDQLAAAGARMALAIASALPAKSTGRGIHKRGPKPHPAADRAKMHLIALASSVDGLPDRQGVIVDWLRTRLETEGPEVPSDSTLGRWVAEFLGFASTLDQAALHRFHNSPALQRDFDTPEEYLQWCTIRNRLANKWLHDEALQAQFLTPSDYIASVFETYSTRSSTPDPVIPSPKV